MRKLIIQDPRNIPHFFQDCMQGLFPVSLGKRSRNSPALDSLEPGVFSCWADENWEVFIGTERREEVFENIFRNEFDVIEIDKRKTAFSGIEAWSINNEGAMDNTNNNIETKVNIENCLEDRKEKEPPSFNIQDLDEKKQMFAGLIFLIHCIQNT